MITFTHVNAVITNVARKISAASDIVGVLVHVNNGVPASSPSIGILLLGDVKICRLHSSYYST